MGYNIHNNKSKKRKCGNTDNTNKIKAAFADIY